MQREATQVMLWLSNKKKDPCPQTGQGMNRAIMDPPSYFVASSLPDGGMRRNHLRLTRVALSLSG